jgi:N-acetylneuraminic acid mutarotase
MVRGGTRLVLYGGEHVARTPLEDEQALWVADCCSDGTTWQWKCCTPSTAMRPPPRVAHTQVAVGDRYVYVFGGRAGITMGEKPMNDLWKLDTESLEWTMVEPSVSSPPPSPRSFHRMVAVEPSSIYVFGGCSADGRLADLFQFDLTTSTWHELGASPLLRGRGGANLLVLQNKEQMAVIAGFAGEETNDGHRFDLSTKTWQDELMSAPEGLRPRSVCVAGSFSAINKAVLFGGEVDPSERGHEGAGGFENDVVLLDGTTGEYLQTVRASSGASPEARGWSDGDVFGNSLYIFGGLAGDDNSPKRLNDLWRLDLE